jgi:hypothetical protein
MMVQIRKQYFIQQILLSIMTATFILHEYVIHSFCLNHCWEVDSVVNMTTVSQDSAVSIATGYRLDGWGVRIRVPLGARFFSSPSRPGHFFRPIQPPIQLVLGGSFLGGVKRPGMKLTTHLQLVPRWRIHGSIRGGIGKFPDSYCCNFIGESWWEGRPWSHFRKPIASVFHVTLRHEHALILHECFFDSVFRFICDGWQNWAKCLHQVLREAR